jgi:hypothetical protein
MEFFSLEPNGFFSLEPNGHNSNFPSKTKKQSTGFNFDEYIPNHSDFLKTLRTKKEETVEEILRDIESKIIDEIEQEVVSNQEIPFERFENVPRSKTQEFPLKQKKFAKINNKELCKSFSQNKLRRKSSLSQALSNRKVHIYFKRTEKKF